MYAHCTYTDLHFAYLYKVEQTNANKATKSVHKATTQYIIKNALGRKKRKME